MKKIIVSGGYGFSCSNLIKYLIKKKEFVINIYKLSYSANKYNLKTINKKNYVFYKGDIGNKYLIYKIIFKYKPNYFFNLAAETHVDRSIDAPKSFIDNNITDKNILIVCYDGKSISPFLVALYIAEYSKIDKKSIYDIMLTKDSSLSLWFDLSLFYNM